MRPCIIWMLAMIVSGSTCSRSFGQAFNFRYDSHEQLRPEAAFDVEKAIHGGYVLFVNSAFQDSLYYSSVATALRIDVQGTVISVDRIEYPLHATYTGWANNAVALSIDGFAVAGTTVSQDTTQRPTLCLADTAGNFTAFIEYGYPDQTWIGRQVKQTPDGGFILCGETSAVGIIDGFLLKLDSLGNQDWLQTYGLPNKREYLLSVVVDPSGGYIVGGQQQMMGLSYDQWIIRTDSAGSLIWQNDYGTPYNDEAVANLEGLSDGNTVMASSWAFLNSDIGRPILLKFDTTGGILWQYAYGLDEGTLYAVKERDSGDLIAAGTGYTSLGIQGALLCTNSVGDSLWMRYYYYQDSILTDGEGELKDVIPTDDGGFIAVGVAYGSASLQPHPYSQDVWVIKVDSMGCLIPGCDLSTVFEAQITNYRDALRVAPNPASNTAQLTWQLPRTLTGKGNSRLSVVSADGRRVAELPIDLPSGSHALDVRDFPPGAYWLHVVAGGSWVMGAKLVVE